MTASTEAGLTAAQVTADWSAGTNYYASDQKFYLSWNGNFQGQMRTTGQSSTFEVYAFECGGQCIVWQVNGGPNCLEYDRSGAAVIADTCTPSRASQQWAPFESGKPNYYNWANQYNGCMMFADSDTNGSLVNCNVGNSSPNGDYDFKFYPKP
jgi:hypothetical protein